MSLKDTIKIYKCNKCEHEWIGRKPKTPERCPGCGTSLWNR